jgi:hypothetical protein
LGEGGKILQKEGWKTSMRRQCDWYGVCLCTFTLCMQCAHICV